MAYVQVENISIEHADILPGSFRNFSGKETQYNRAGDRNFCVAIAKEDADRLSQVGWNVRMLAPRDPNDEPKYYLKVSVKYGVIPPNVYLISKGGKNLMDEGNIGELDYSEIKNADLIIRPYCWEVNGKTGIKAYLKTAYVTLEEDAFASKYADNADDEYDLPF